jgi:hypothetical protein
MHDKYDFNFQNKALYIEHALRNVHEKKLNHHGSAPLVERLVSKYICADKQLDFLDELLCIIINPGESTDLTGKCKLIEQALFEHFNRKNYSRYYGDSSIIQELATKYVEKDKQLDFLDELLALIILKNKNYI